MYINQNKKYLEQEMSLIENLVDYYLLGRNEMLSEKKLSNNIAEILGRDPQQILYKVRSCIYRKM